MRPQRAALRASSQAGTDGHIKGAAVRLSAPRVQADGVVLGVAVGVVSALRFAAAATYPLVAIYVRLLGVLPDSRGPDADQVEASVIDARLRTLVYERQSMLAEMYRGRYIPPDVELPN